MTKRKNKKFSKLHNKTNKLEDKIKSLEKKMENLNQGHVTNDSLKLLENLVESIGPRPPTPRPIEKSIEVLPSVRSETKNERTDMVNDNKTNLRFRRGYDSNLQLKILERKTLREVLKKKEDNQLRPCQNAGEQVICGAAAGKRHVCERKFNQRESDNSALPCMYPVQNIKCLAYGDDYHTCTEFASVDPNHPWNYNQRCIRCSRVHDPTITCEGALDEKVLGHLNWYIMNAAKIPPYAKPNQKFILRKFTEREISSTDTSEGQAEEAEAEEYKMRNRPLPRTPQLMLPTPEPSMAQAELECEKCKVDVEKNQTEIPTYENIKRSNEYIVVEESQEVPVKRDDPEQEEDKKSRREGLLRDGTRKQPKRVNWLRNIKQYVPPPRTGEMSQSTGQRGTETLKRTNQGAARRPMDISVAYRQLKREKINQYEETSLEGRKKAILDIQFQMNGLYRKQYDILESVATQIGDKYAGADTVFKGFTYSAKEVVHLMMNMIKYNFASIYSLCSDLFICLPLLHSNNMISQQPNPIPELLRKTPVWLPVGYWCKKVESPKEYQLCCPMAIKYGKSCEIIGSNNRSWWCDHNYTNHGGKNFSTNEQLVDLPYRCFHYDPVLTKEVKRFFSLEGARILLNSSDAKCPVTRHDSARTHRVLICGGYLWCSHGFTNYKEAGNIELTYRHVFNYSERKANANRPGKWGLLRKSILQKK